MKVHTISGIAIALTIAVISLIGSIIVFRAELDRLSYSELYFGQGNTAPVSVPVDHILRDIRTRFPEYSLTALSLPNDDVPSYQARLSKGKEGIQAFYGTDGKLHGTRKNGTTPVGKLIEFHRSFLLGDTGRLIAFATGCLFLLSTITGAYVYRKSLLRIFRKNPFKAGFKTVTLHTFAGSLAIVMNLLWSVTGIYQQWEHVGPLLSGEAEKEKPASNPAAKQPSKPKSPKAGLAFSVDSLLQSTLASYPNFNLRGLAFSSKGPAAITLRGHEKGGNPLYGKNGHSIEFSKEGKQLAVRDPHKAATSKKIESAFHALHAGDFAGIPVKLLYSLFALLPLTLSITGITIWVRRLRRNGKLAIA